MDVTSRGACRFPSPRRGFVSDDGQIPEHAVRDPGLPAGDGTLFELAGLRERLYFDPGRSRAGILERPVMDKRVLEGIRAGDRVEITCTRARAIRIERGRR